MGDTMSFNVVVVICRCRWLLWEGICSAPHLHGKTFEKVVPRPLAESLQLHVSRALVHLARPRPHGACLELAGVVRDRLEVQLARLDHVRIHLLNRIGLKTVDGRRLGGAGGGGFVDLIAHAVISRIPIKLAPPQSLNLRDTEHRRGFAGRGWGEGVPTIRGCSFQTMIENLLTFWQVQAGTNHANYLLFSSLL